MNITQRINEMNNRQQTEEDYLRLERMGRLGVVIVLTVIAAAAVTAQVQGHSVREVLTNPVWYSALPVWIIMWGTARINLSRAQHAKLGTQHS